MPSIKQITMPNGNTYDLHDSRVDNLEGFTKYLGKTTTPLSDGSTTNPIVINGESVTAESGDIVLYGNKEFIFDGASWAELGDLGALGTLAYKNSVSVSTVATGSVSAPSVSVQTAGETASVKEATFTVTNEVLTITETTKTVKVGDASYQASQPTFTGTAASGTVTYDPA